MCTVPCTVPGQSGTNEVEVHGAPDGMPCDDDDPAKVRCSYISVSFTSVLHSCRGFGVGVVFENAIIIRLEFSVSR